MYALIVILLTIGQIFIAWPIQAESDKKDPVVYVQTATKTSLFDVHTFPARILPKIDAAVLSEGQGLIRKIYVSLGQEVQKNEVLAIVENTDPVYRYQPIKIKAPVRGVVSTLEVTEGGLVSKGGKILSIMDPYQVRVLIEVASGDLSTIKRGLKGTLEVNHQEAVVEVEVLGPAPFVDPATGTSTCELKILTPAVRLRPGLLSKVIFKTNQRNSVSIPEHAIVYKGKKTLIRLIDKDLSKYIDINLGQKRNGTVEVIDGLKVGDIYIERASDFIADGQKVQVKRKKESS